MTRSHAASWVMLGLIAVVQPALGDITINGPTNHLASIALTGFPAGQSGTSTLGPDPVTHLAPPALGSVFFNTFSADAAQYPGWTAVPGAALGGTLLINDYLATAPGPRAGGARMNATYTPATGEGALRWVQMFDSTNSGRHIDPFPNDDEGAAGAAGDQPFYYTQDEFNMDRFGLTFDDNPQIGPILPVPFTFTATFDLFLVSANFTNSTVTVHDGFRWGYGVVTTVPAPDSAAMGTIGMLLLFRRRR